MSNTLTIRLPKELMEWLTEMARKTGLPAGRIIRHQLERARSESDGRPWMKLAGAVDGPKNLSTRKGFSPK